MATQPLPTRPLTRPIRSESASIAAHPSTAPLPARCTRSTLSQSAPSLVSADYQSDADESDSSGTNALTQLQQAYNSDDSEVEGNGDTDSPDTHTDDTDVDLLDEDDTYLQDLARSARVASQTIAQADPDRPIAPLRQLENDPNAAFYAHLLDPVLRTELRTREFSEFLPYQHRHILQVDRELIRVFYETKAQKFVDMVSPSLPTDSMRWPWQLTCSTPS